MNEITFCLTWQQGMLEAKSVKKSDLKFFDYKKEELSYWLASPGVFIIGSYCCFSPGAVNSGDAVTGYALFYSDGISYEIWLGVRPVMVLASKIKKDRIPLVEL